MSKRKFDMLEDAPAMYMSFEDIPSADVANYTMLHLPGQFPGNQIWVAVDDAAAPSPPFETFREFFTVNGARALFATGLAYFTSFLHTDSRQTIVPESVPSPSGSRKKILLDGGLVRDARNVSSSNAAALAFRHSSNLSTEMPRNPHPYRFRTPPGTIRPVAERLKCKHTQWSTPKEKALAKKSGCLRAQSPKPAARRSKTPSPLSQNGSSVLRSEPCKRRKAPCAPLDISLDRSDIDIYHDNILEQLKAQLRQELKGEKAITREEVLANAFPKELSVGVTEADILRAQPSNAIMDDLRERLKKQLEITMAEEEAARPPPPIVKIEPLVTPLLKPLTTGEVEKINATIKKTNGGDKDVPLARNLKTRDMKTLLPTLFNGDSRAWLNDQVVNDYLEILVNQAKAKAGFKHNRGGPAPPVHAFPSQLWTNLSRGIPVNNWAMRKQLNGQKFLDSRLILVPICHGNHWRLIAIKPQERVVEYLDSLDTLHGNYRSISSVIFGWIKSELGDLYIENEWKFQSGRSNRQLNGSDCGVFTCMNALAFLREDQPERVQSIEGMMEARQRIAITILEGKTSELD